MKESGGEEWWKDKNVCAGSQQLPIIPYSKLTLNAAELPFSDGRLLTATLSSLCPKPQKRQVRDQIQNQRIAKWKGEKRLTRTSRKV